MQQPAYHLCSSILRSNKLLQPELLYCCTGTKSSELVTIWPSHLHRAWQDTAHVQSSSQQLLWQKLKKRSNNLCDKQDNTGRYEQLMAAQQGNLKHYNQQVVTKIHSFKVQIKLVLHDLSSLLFFPVPKDLHFVKISLTFSLLLSVKPFPRIKSIHVPVNVLQNF